jgi:SAM-dependent methyltransferase
MTCDEAWRPTPETELSPRKQAILEQADRIATQRDLWRSRNAAFYASDLAYMRFLIPEGSRVLDLGCGTGALLAGLKPLRGVGIDFSSAMIQVARCNYPSLEFHVGDVEHLAGLVPMLGGPFDFVLLSDTLGYLDDCQAALEQIHDVCDAGTRIVVAYYSHLWEPALRLGEAVGLRMPQPEVNFLGHLDIQNILQLADFETIKQEWRQLLPLRLFGLETLINRFVAPLPIIRRLCLRYYLVARSLRRARRRDLSASVIIPCRNECGNIEDAIRQLPRFCDQIEVIFVEGHSSDGTYAECRRIAEAYRSDWPISVLQQTGKGKGDAVRKGFDEASGDVLMILDADLTVPPKELSKFYEAIASGKGEFINGTRLVYPVEKGAMRILNYWANRTFALVFSFLLNMRFTDTLCGTKVLTKRSYQKISANRRYFGEFDPFGDYDLIFGAAKNNLKCVEIPIRYRDRSYGEPQISRFRDGWLLLRMVVFAWRKLKAI